MRDRLVTAAAAALLGLLLAGCPMDQGFGAVPAGGGGADGPEEDPYWCCDPDEPFCLCEGYWHCTDGISGKRCQQDNPQMPDGGNWTCEYTAAGLTCTGQQGEHPDDGIGSEWRCTDIGEGMIECSRASDDGDYPDGEGNGPWDCYYADGGRQRVCEQGEGGGGPDSGEWECTEAADGTIVCVNHNPNTPDGGTWDCVQSNGRDICEGSSYPDGSGGNGWDCTQQGEFVRCQNGEPQQPDGGGSQPWDCRWGDGGNVLTCVQRGDDGSLGGGDNGGGDNGDNGGGNPGDAGNGNNGDNPGGGGGDNGGGGDCACPPNAERFCDTPTYCNWGRQVCVDDGNGNAEWGACIETNNIPAECFRGQQFDEWAEQCAIDAGFCVQDFWDLDGDWDTWETLGRNCADLECVDDGGGGGLGGFWGF